MVAVTGAQPTPPPAELADPIGDARALIGWATDTHGDGLCVTASFGDAVLAHLVSATVPGTPITLLDTGYLFAETEWFADDLSDRFGIELRIVRPHPEIDGNVWQYDTDACCAQRKVEPLQRALAGHTAWMTGLRRADSSARANTPRVHHDLFKGVEKINPIATWSDADVAGYAEANGLPDHPLADRGYASIGCWPCTRPVEDGASARSGRWHDSQKTECGLHL